MLFIDNSESFMAVILSSNYSNVSEDKAIFGNNNTNFFISFLREQDVENYISELIESLPQLDGLDKSFHSFYVCTAVRKFFFFLDPIHTGTIRILV